MGKNQPQKNAKNTKEIQTLCDLCVLLRLKVLFHSCSVSTGINFFFGFIENPCASEGQARRLTYFTGS